MFFALYLYRIYVWFLLKNKLIHVKLYLANRYQKEEKAMTDVNRQYKDRLFKFIFGNEANKEWTLSLYNAIHESHYDNPDDISFNTIEDAVYMGMKNDVSYIICFQMELWEHQSTFNPNMPMRFFIYSGRLYEKYIRNSDYFA